MDLSRRLANQFFTILISKASKDTLLLVFLQTISQVNSLLAIVFVTRYLGPTNFGMLSFTQTFVSFAFVISSALDGYYTWKFATNPDKRETIIRECFRTRTLINGITLLIGIGVLSAFSLPFAETAIILSALVIGYVTNSVSFLATFVLIEKRVREYVIAGICTSFTILFARLAGVYLELPLWYFVGIVIAETLILLFYLRVFASISTQNLHPLPLSFKFAFKELYKARYFVGIVGATLLVTRIDQFFIKDFLTSADLGLYAAAVRLAEYPSVFAGILGSVLTPRITSANQTIFRSRAIFVGFLLFLGLGIGFALLLIFFGDLLIRFLYGAEFSQAYTALALYALALPGMWLMNFSNLIFGAFNRVRRGFLIALVGGVLSITLLINLTPKWGIIGAAASAVIAYTFVGVFSSISAYRAIRSNFKLTSGEEPHI